MCTLLVALQRAYGRLEQFISAGHTSSASSMLMPIGEDATGSQWLAQQSSRRTTTATRVVHEAHSNGFGDWRLATSTVSLADEQCRQARRAMDSQSMQLHGHTIPRRRPVLAVRQLGTSCSRRLVVTCARADHGLSRSDGEKLRLRVCRLCRVGASASSGGRRLGFGWRVR